MFHISTHISSIVCFEQAPVGGFFNTFPIPFGKHALVTVRADPDHCKTGYVQG